MDVDASEALLSPILVRPVREQLEHDRVIRLLQAKYKRKFEVAINPGNEQAAPVGGPGTNPWYPDLVLQSAERSRKLLGVVEVETAESVNNLEAMSQWAAFGRLQAPFHLYIPVSSIDVARRLCLDLQIPVTEIWAYHAIGDQMRFTLVQRAAEPEAPKVPKAAPTPSVSASRSGASRAAPPRARPSRTAGARSASRATANGRRPAAAKSKSTGSRRTVKTSRSRSASAGSKAQKRR